MNWHPNFFAPSHHFQPWKKITINTVNDLYIDTKCYFPFILCVAALSFSSMSLSVHLIKIYLNDYYYFQDANEANVAKKGRVLLRGSCSQLWQDQIRGSCGDKAYQVIKSLKAVSGCKWTQLVPSVSIYINEPLIIKHYQCGNIPAHPNHQPLRWSNG